jgi:hypothetical protein
MAQDLKPYRKNTKNNKKKAKIKPKKIQPFEQTIGGKKG